VWTGPSIIRLGYGKEMEVVVAAVVVVVG